jgi:hypothetical protein
MLSLSPRVLSVVSARQRTKLTKLLNFSSPWRTNTRTSSPSCPFLPPFSIPEVKFPTQFIRKPKTSVMASVVDQHWFQCGSRSSFLGQWGSGSRF